MMCAEAGGRGLKALPAVGLPSPLSSRVFSGTANTDHQGASRCARRLVGPSCQRLSVIRSEVCDVSIPIQ
jgi:hypothetical protein